MALTGAIGAIGAMPTPVRVCLILTRRKNIWISFYPLKGLFGRFPPSFIGHDARIAPSSTDANLSENPLE